MIDTHDIGERLADIHSFLAYLANEVMSLRIECTALRKDAERYRDRDILTAHSGANDRREWYSAGAWLYPGDELCVVSRIDATPQERDDG